jgi:hypothetical protein
MTKATFTKCFEWFLKRQGREITAEARQHYYDEFQHTPDEAFIKAIKTAARESPPGDLPSVAKLERYVNDEYERLKRRHKEKTAPPDKEQDGARVRSLIAYLERLEAEGKQREVDERSKQRQERTERRAARVKELNEQLKSRQAQTPEGNGGQTIH